MSTRIIGASVWEQDMYDYVSGHVVTEGAILEEYQQLAEDPSGSPAFRFLAGLILADERRHHQIFNDLGRIDPADGSTQRRRRADPVAARSQSGP